MTGRILFVQPTAERYGGDKALLLLARGLAERGWSIQVALHEDGPLGADLDGIGIPWEVVDSGAVRRVFGPSDWLRFAAVDLPRSTSRIGKMARAADIVHVNSSVSVGGVLGGRLARRPVVLHVRESHADHPGAWRAYARLVGRRAARVIAISSAIAEEARIAGLRDRTELVHDGLAFAARAPLHPPADHVQIVAVGRLNDWKGHELLIDAVAELRSKSIDARATIAGGIYPGQERIRDSLRDQVARLGLGDQVELPGFVDDVESLLRGASVFVLASRRPEPFGLALAEAMAQGIACVATAHGGPVDIIEDGVTGVLVAPGSSSAIADAVEGLARDPERRTAIGEASATAVRARFSIDSTIDAVEGIYRSLLR
ncbi:MAG: glycosyltransferase [Microthrixaceae bacterium]